MVKFPGREELLERFCTCRGETVKGSYMVDSHYDCSGSDQSLNMPFPHK